MARLSQTIQPPGPRGRPNGSNGWKTSKNKDVAAQGVCAAQGVTDPVAQGVLDPLAQGVLDPIAAFVQVMDQWVAGEELAWNVWRAAYADLAKHHNWPALSDTALAVGLQRAGCIKRQVDRRKQGRGSYVAYRIGVAA